MTIQISHSFNWISPTFDLHFIRLHHLFNFSSYIPQPHIHTSLPYSCVGGISNRLQQLVICRIKGDCKGTVDDPSVDMCAKVDFTNVVVA
jgi:hypothetical protein